MKLERINLLLGGLCLLSLAAMPACDKTDDPSAIDVKNLKYPRSLSITDNGDGSIKLNWQASNFEGDFEGYNIYGVKMSDDEISDLADKGLVKGTPLQLLDSEGNARSETKDILAKFNYNKDKPLEEAKSTEPTDGGERKISYLPIHNLNGDEPVLPSCYPSANTDGSYTCAPYTKDNVSTVKAEKSGALSANGTISYEIQSLMPGEQYCFVIFSVQDSGKEISQTSTNFECVTPSIETAFNFAAAAGTEAKALKLSDYAAACTTTCPDLSASSATTYGSYLIASPVASATKDNSTQGVLYIEEYGTRDGIFFVAAKNCGILDMGIRSSLSDETLASTIPTFENEAGSGNALNSNGYSPAGASLTIIAKHAYIYACEDTEDSKKVFYHWLYVNQATNPERTTAGTVAFKLRPGLTSVAK